MSFKSVANKIANKGGYSKKAAAAILASSSRKASPGAKKKNPILKKVKLCHHVLGYTRQVLAIR